MKDQCVPDFESPDFLRTHINSILAFYAPNVFDSEGGFFHIFWMMAEFITIRHDIWSVPLALSSIMPMLSCNRKMPSIATGPRMAWPFFRITTFSHRVTMPGN